jgi:ribosomal protein L34E
MAQRVTLRKRQPYNTTSNRRRVVKTPGGKLVVHHIKKLAVSLARNGTAKGQARGMLGGREWVARGW